MHNGRSITFHNGPKKMSPTIIPAAAASSILTTRLRSSRM